MKTPIITAVALCSCVALLGQEKPDQTPPKPRTQLEAFAAETGAVIIKGFSEMGKVAAMGSVEVDCREFTNASTGQKRYGIVIEIKEAGSLQRESSSFVDFEEIPSLIAGIDYISKIQPSVTTLTNFEATYTTKGDFAITVFNNARGVLSVAVSSGRFGRTTAYLPIGKVGELRTLIGRAKAKIEEISK